MVPPVPGRVQGPYFPLRPTWLPSGQPEEHGVAPSEQGTVPITAPPAVVAAPLSREEEILFVEQVVGIVPGSKSDHTNMLFRQNIRRNILTLLVIANRLYNNSSSTSLSKEAREQLLQDPIVIGLLRTLFLRVTSNTDLKPVKLAVPVGMPSLRENFAAFSAAKSSRSELKLPEKVLELFRRGNYTIEVSYTTRQNEITGYIVVLKSGTNIEATLEYKDGKFVPSKENPILARATIAYLQYLLVGAGALGRKGWEEGTFCKLTLNALSTFLSSQNLAGLPNLKDSLSLLQSKQREAEQAIGQYKAIVGNDDTSLYKRLRAAERALDAISVVLDTAKRYRSAIPQGAPKEYLQLLELSNTLIGSMSLEAKGILQVVCGNQENNWKGLLVRVDVKSLNAMRKRLLEVFKTKGKGKAWHVIGYVDNLIGFVMKLRRWKELSATLDLGTEYTFMSTLAAKAETRAREYLKEIPGESLYVAERMQVLGEPMERANISTEESAAAPQLITRSQNGHVISRLIGNNPSREVLLGFIRQSLRGKKPQEIAGIFRTFSMVAGDGNLSALASETYGRQVREDLLGIINNPEVEQEGDDDESDAAWYAQDALQEAAGDDERLSGQLFSLNHTLYQQIHEYNAYAATSGKQKITAREVIVLAKEVLKALEQINPGLEPKEREKEKGRILAMLANVSNDPDTADVELSQELERQLSQLKLQSLSGAQTLTVTPLALRAMETKYSELSVLPGAVAYDDLARWSSTGAAEFPKADLRPGGYYFVSVFGHTQEVPSPEITDASLRLVPVNNFAGSQYERSPIEFVRIEKLASLKLAIAKYVPISDAQVLSLSGSITARLTAVDLYGIVKVFGESNFWIFRPGTTDLLPIESAVLLKAADIIERERPEDAKLIRRALKGATKGNRFNQEERIALIRIVSSLNPTIFATLTQVEKDSLSSGAQKLKYALTMMLHKKGLSQQKQEKLNILAAYLAFDPNASIVDSRLASEDPPAELIVRLRAADKSGKFNEADFRRAYKEAILVLRETHEGLQALASKYPPEDAGYTGLWDFGASYYREAFERAKESTAPQRPQDMQVLGLPSEMNFENNVMLYPALTSELEVIEQRLAVLEGLNDDLKLSISVGILIALSATAQKTAAELRAIPAIGEANPLLQKFTALAGSIASLSSDPNAIISERAALLFQVRTLSDEISRDPLANKQLARVQRVLGQLKTALESIQSSASSVTAQAGPALGRVLQLFPAAKELSTRLEKATEKKVLAPLRSFVGPFTQLTDSLEQASGNPAMLYYQTEQLLQISSSLVVKLDEIIPLETNKEKLGHLQNMRQQAQGIYAALVAVRAARDQVMPDFKDKFTLEIRRSAIIDELSSDRFSQDRYARLKEIYPGLFEEEVVLEFTAGVISGEQRHIAGVGGRPTHKTAVEILNAFFKAHPGEEIVLSSLIPEPGEDRETIEAKIALSALLAKIPSKQTVDPLKTVPAMLMPHSGAALRLLSIYSRGQNGGADMTFGPESALEMRDGTDPLYRFYYGITTSLAMSSSRNPRTNLSAQLHMLMMNSPKGQRYISEQLSSNPSGRQLKFSTVNSNDVKAFVRYVKEEILPQLVRSPRLAMQVAFLLRTNRIQVNLVDYDLDVLLRDLPNGEFEIVDSFHASDSMQELSKVLEAVLKVSEEINRTRAAEDIEEYPMTYFDPVRSMQDASISYNQSTEITPLRHIPTISYDGNQALSAGGINHRWMHTEIAHDMATWMAANVPEIPERFVRQMVDGDPAGDFFEAVEKSGTFAANFVLYMPRTISAGFNDFWGGFGDLLRARETGDKKLALEAVTRMRKSLSETTGGFMVFESMPFTFFSDVIKDIENGDFIGAITSALVIYKLTGVSLGLLGQGIRSGAMLPVRTAQFGWRLATGKPNAWLEYKTALSHEVDALRQHTHGRLGLKLAKWSTIIGAAHDGYVAGRGTYRYFRGNLGVSVAPSPVEIGLSVENSAGEAGRGSVAKAADYVTRYRPSTAIPGVEQVQRGKAWFSEGGRYVTEGTLGRLQRTSVSADVVDAASRAPIEAAITDARVNPAFTYDVRIFGSSAYVTVDARTYFQLAESINPAQTKTILEQYCLAKKIRMPKVDAQQLHNDFGPLRQVYAEITTLDNLQRARTNPNTTFEVTLAKGNNKPVTLTIDAQTYLELSQAQTLKETRAIIDRYNRNPNNPQKFKMKLGTMRELHAAFETSRSVFRTNAATLTALVPSGNVFSPYEFLRGATAGIGYDNKYKISVRNSVTGQSQTIEVTGRQIIEILNRQVDPTIVPGRRALVLKQKPVVSPEIDAMITKHFNGQVGQKAMVQMVKTAYAKVHGVFGLLGRKAPAVPTPVPPNPGAPSAQQQANPTPAVPAAQAPASAPAPHTAGPPLSGNDVVFATEGIAVKGNPIVLTGDVTAFAARLKALGVSALNLSAFVAGTDTVSAEAVLQNLERQNGLSPINGKTVVISKPTTAGVAFRVQIIDTPPSVPSPIRQPKRAGRRPVQAARTAAAPVADPIVARFESAKAGALARLDAMVERGVIPSSEAVERKAIAAKSWDRQIAELRQPQPGKKPGMLQNQGSIAAIMLGIAVLQHLDEIKRGEFGGAVKDGLISVGTLKLIGVADEALQPLLLSGGLSKAASGLVGGGIIGAGVALIHNREALFSSSSNARSAALIDVANEGALGAVSAGVGMKVGEVVSSTLTPWVGVPVGFLSGLGTYYLLKEGLEKDLGYAKWIMREMSSGQIEDSLSELRIGGMLLRVEDRSTDTPYFTAETEAYSVGGKTKTVSKAQSTLAFLKGIEEYRGMSDAQRTAFKAQTRPKPGQAGTGDVYEYVGTALDGISRLEVPSYEDLNETAMVQIAKAVHQFRSKGTYRNVQVRLEREVVEEIKHPLTGQVVGQKVKYHVVVRGKEEVLTAEGYQYKDKAFRKEYFASEDVEINGDQQAFSEAVALRQAQTGDSFNISLADVLVSDMNIPFNQLHRFPKVMEELASALMLLGYDPTVYGVNSETVAYTSDSVSMALEDYMEQNKPQQRSIPGMSGPIPVLRLRMEGPKVLEPKMLRGVFQSLQGIASKEPRV